MKRFFVIFIFCFFSLTTLLASFNPEDKREIDQKLNNILRVSQTLPLQKKERIFSEVKSIRQILGTDSEQEINMDLKTSENGKETKKEYLIKSPYLSDIKHFDLQGMNNLMSRLRAAKSYKAQFELIQKINNGSSFTIQQILDLTKVFASSMEKKEVGLVLLPNAVDLENIDQLYSLFSSDRDKLTINKIADENLH